MAAMNEVSDLMPDTVLLDYIRAQIPSNDKLWTFRKHLAVQYACQVCVSVCVCGLLSLHVCVWCGCHFRCTMCEHVQESVEMCL